MRIKIFGAAKGVELERKVNEFLDSIDVDVMKVDDIKYNYVSATSEYDPWHSVMIIYHIDYNNGVKG